MVIDFLLKGFAANKDKEAIIWQDQSFNYGWILASTKAKLTFLQERLKPNSVVTLEADFSPNAVAILLALIECGCIIVPLTDSVTHKKTEFRQIAEVEFVITVATNDEIVIEHTGIKVEHEFLLHLKTEKRPGLVLFSSGSTGKSKAALHDFVPLLEKFKVPRHGMRTISFLLFDHIGGVNTLLYTLSNGGCVVTVNERSPEEVCRSIEKYHVATLPTSPTFINLLLLSEAYKLFDLSSLTLVTYGTEVMPESTLLRFNQLFPNVRLLQTYGLSEIGIMRSKSKSSESLWVKIGGEGFETRIVNNILEIKANSAMMGYLNAPSPFTADGWFHTGDVVEVDGEYMKILGRKSEMINVGGEKVYPAEIESVLQLMDGVEDVAISAERNPITGNLVKARVKLKTEETIGEFRKRMREFCKGKLEGFKVPQKVVLVDTTMYGERFKKMRKE
ncbi:Acyl-CoA synthetase (AMP-forming)/AMP-acid ligase II [Pelosinus fermentans]|uniref:ANL family adenylate-forming protein n=1 Tax=Pelosinus fermentans TaxID=365349 RepID=UPI0002685FA6|nr:fatty acid--CoA ligase family protein [Pelosinus fermentans]OAM92872.1 o-succinylbenzoate--CoA ligase [Pelosinus fermentans DSM 17108]SDQ59536.1 Acyl-CoA synthetase (AMP-forming)/AMP-acid ligase II [Pelosinus fermentans]